MASQDQVNKPNALGLIVVERRAILELEAALSILKE